jgi:hypothetical protein
MLEMGSISPYTVKWAFIEQREKLFYELQSD